MCTSPTPRRPRRPRRSVSKPSKPSTRNYLALAVVLPVLFIGISTILVPSAEGIFDKLLPSMTLILGYYFGSRQR